MGAGFKVWSTGDLVNASDFNNYIQEQVVMVFADSSARGSAISSPEEGMFAFLKDTNDLTFYDGSSWVSYIGCLLYTSPSPRDVEESRMPSSA